MLEITVKREKILQNFCKVFLWNGKFQRHSPLKYYKMLMSNQKHLSLEGMSSCNSSIKKFYKFYIFKDIHWNRECIEFQCIQDNCFKPCFKPRIFCKIITNFLLKRLFRIGYPGMLIKLATIIYLLYIKKRTLNLYCLYLLKMNSPQTAFKAFLFAFRIYPELKKAFARSS